MKELISWWNVALVLVGIVVAAAGSWAPAIGIWVLVIVDRLDEIASAVSTARKEATHG